MSSIPETITSAQHENLTAEEDHFDEYFRGFDQERFIEQGISIFRASTEVVPVRDEHADLALKGLLTTLLTGEAPEPAFGALLAQRTTIAWRQYTKVLLEKIAEIDPDTIPISANIRISNQVD